MSQKSQPADQVKTLGRSPRSLTAPLAAFTMALLLGSYCISSIRTARRDAQSHSNPSVLSNTTNTNTRPHSHSYREKPVISRGAAAHERSSSLVTQALEKMREEEEKRVK